MNKTIFNLEYKKSILISAFMGIFFGFLSNVFYVNGIMETIFYILRFALFIGIYLFLFFVEKKNLEFKEANKRMCGYIVVNCICNTLFSIFVSAHLLPGVFLTFSAIVCFWLISAFFVEILILKSNNLFLKKVYFFNEKIGLKFASPIIKFISRKITND